MGRGGAAAPCAGLHEDVLDGGPLPTREPAVTRTLGIYDDHRLDQFLQLRTTRDAHPSLRLEAAADALVVGGAHLHHQVGDAYPAKRRIQRQDLVEGAAHRPHVRLGVVAHALHYFGSHVERRADSGLRQVLGELEHARDAEVSHLDVSLLR